LTLTETRRGRVRRAFFVTAPDMGLTWKVLS
jgi:hypothetical protein